VRRTVALASLPADVETGTPLTVDVFGAQVGAEVARDVLYDPENARVRA
jgi:glycine cleavage system aminomethyltransferase T